MKKELLNNEFYYLSNNKGLEVYFTALGASIYCIKFNGEVMTMTLSNMSDFENPCNYYGKTIGPIAGRSKHGEVIVDGKSYFLPVNENPDNNLHSGINGLHNTTFEVIEESDRVLTFKTLLKEEVIKMPGNVSYEVRYEITDNNELLLSFKAETDKKTVMNITNHSYFCLGEPDLNNLKLTIPSDKFILTEADTLLPIREEPLTKPLDFNISKNVMEDIYDSSLQNHRTKGYDHFWFLNKPYTLLESNKFGLEITSDYQGIVIYSVNYDVPEKQLNPGSELTHRGLAMEPEDTQLVLTEVNPGKPYIRNIKYRFYKV